MNFDFDTVVPRRGSDSVKWDLRPDVLPMWVADMDFRAAPCILKALQRKIDHGVFGYTHIPDSFHAAVRNWFAGRHGWTIGTDAIIPISGLVPAASVVLEALGCRGGKVVMQTPAYNCFFSSIRNTGGVLVENRLPTAPHASSTSISMPSNKPAATLRSKLSCCAIPTTRPDACGAGRNSRGSERSASGTASP